MVLRVLIGVMASRAETCASVRHFDDRKARADSETVDESRERQGRGGGGQMGGGGSNRRGERVLTTKAKKGETRENIK